MFTKKFFPKAQPQVTADKKQPLMGYDAVKSVLKSLPTDVLAKEFKAAYDRGQSEGRIPLTIQVLADLHKEAQYSNGNTPRRKKIYDDPYLNATAFVNQRDKCINMPRTKQLRPTKPKANVRWAADVVEREPSPEFLAKARRKKTAPKEEINKITLSAQKTELGDGVKPPALRRTSPGKENL